MVIRRGTLAYWSSHLSIHGTLDRLSAGRGEELLRPPRTLPLDVRIRWTDRWDPLSPVEGRRHFLLTREVTIPRPMRQGAPERKFTWQFLIPADREGRVTSEMEKRARVLTTTPGQELDGRNPVADIALIHSVAYYLDTVLEAKTGAYTLSLLHTGYEVFRKKVDQAYTEAVSQQLRPFYRELGLVAERAAKDVDYRASLRSNGTDYAALATILHRQLQTAHRLSGEGYADAQRTYGRLEAAFKEHCDQFHFEGRKYPESFAVIEALRGEADGGRRKRLFRAYMEHCHRFHAARSNLYDAIPRMNRHARRAGLSGYVDHIFPGRFGFTEGEFYKIFGMVMRETQGAARAYVRKLSSLKRELTGGADGTVYAWDYHYLDAQWMRKRLGGSEPTLDFRQAMSVIQAIFADLGIDLRHPPYNRIVMDLMPRTNKSNEAGMAVGATHGRSYFTLGGDPTQRITPTQLQRMLHELTHPVSYQTASQQDGGYHLLSSGDFLLKQWSEGMAETIGNIVKDPILARRYFSGIEGFTDDYFAALEEITPLRDNFSVRMRLMIAWMEVNLYRDRNARGEARPLATRLRAWPRMLRSVQGIEEMPDGISFPLTAPHFVYEDHHLYYAAYPLGQLMTDRVYRSIVRSPDLVTRRRELRRFGRVILGLMDKGATLTAHDIARAASPGTR